MTRALGLSLALAGLTLTITTRPTTAGARAAETLRTVYFSAVDGKSAAVSDLTAADITLKEGGRDQKITKLELASAPMQIVVIVDDRGTGGFQVALAQFVQTTFGKAQYQIAMMNPQSTKLTQGFTGDADPLRAALGRLGQRGRVDVDGEQIVDAVRSAAKDLVQAKAARPVIVVLSASGETALSDRATEAMNDLKDSGAGLNVVYFTSAGLGKVLGDGPKQSGGQILPANGSAAFVQALARVADSLLHQYVVTYSLPDGVKMNERLEIKTTRKGLTLVAPTRIPDK